MFAPHVWRLITNLPSVVVFHLNNSSPPSPGADIETERTVLSLRKHTRAIAFLCGRFSSCFQQPCNWSADRLCAAALASGEKKFCADTAARKTASQKAFNLRC